MNDHVFIDYCDVHCRTERALFHRIDVVRIYQLAGQPLSGAYLPEWIAVRPGIMAPLVEAARRKLAATRSTTLPQP